VLAGLSDGTLEPPPIEEIPLAAAADVIGAAARGERPIVGRLMVRP
jgi:hypothetical protein